MTYCYFCEDVHLGYITTEYYCENCKKLQQLCKAVGVEKITQSIKIRFDKEKDKAKDIDGDLHSRPQTRSQTKTV